MSARWMVVIVGMGLVVPRADAAAGPALGTEKEKVSYAMAVAFARSVQRQGIDLDAEVFARGLRDGLAKGPVLLPDDELRAAMGGAVSRMKQRQAEDAARRQTAGAAFLAENAGKEGVVTLPSGLQYRVLREGKGKKPTDADTVECHFRGTLVDGKEFANTSRGKPAAFKVGRAVPGWRQALKLMPVGSKWQLFVPPELGYGKRGAARKGRIAPSETLVYEIELLAVRPRVATPSHDKTALRSDEPPPPASRPR